MVKILNSAPYKPNNILTNNKATYYDSHKASNFDSSNVKCNLERNKILNSERYCTYCLQFNKVYVEDELHVLLVCVRYESVRVDFVNPQYIHNPSSEKFVKLMESENTLTISELAVCINNVFKISN